MSKADHQLAGMEIRFYPNDHEPEHFHALKRGHWEIKVYFRLCSKSKLEYELKWKLKSTGPSPDDLKQLRNYVQKHRAALELEWIEKVCR